MGRRHATRLALCLALCGCGSSEPPGGDAGPDGGDGDGDGGIGIEPPALPVLTPCPEGWREVPPEDPSDPYGYATCDPWPDGDPVTPPLLTPCPEGWREVPPEDPTDPLGVVTCDPWPVTGHEECEAVDEAHFPGEPGCTRVGSDCPEGDWADDLPADAPILYVRAGEPEGGDGTQEIPFGTIAEAMDAAEPGTVIALSKGTFDEEVLLDTGVTLWGACVAETLVTCSTESDLRGTVNAGGPDTVLRNVRVSGERIGIWSTGRLPAIDVQDVVVDGARDSGLQISTGATLVSVVVRDTQPRPDGTWGVGLAVFSAGNWVGSVDVRRAVFERNREVGVSVFGEGTILTMADVVVRDTRSRESGEAFGYGMEASSGSHVGVSRAVFEGNREVGVFAFGEGTILTVTDVVVRDTQGRQSDSSGGGMAGQAGAQVTASRAVFERNRTVGVLALDEGTLLTLTDVVVRDTQSQESDGVGGCGMHVASGAHVGVSRAVFERNREGGITAREEGTNLTLTDVVVRDTEGQQSDGTHGSGLAAWSGARVEMSRAVLERNRAVGVLAELEGTLLSLTDVVVRDTQSQESDGVNGSGLQASEGAQAELNRAVLERNRAGGAAAAGEGTVLTLTNVVVRDTEGQQSDGTLGFGLFASSGARVEMSRAVLERNRLVGASLVAGATFTATDVVIRDSRRRESDGVGGCGLEATEGSQAELNRAVLERNIGVGAAAFHPRTSLVMVDTVLKDTFAGPGSHEAGTGVASVSGANVDMSRFLVTRNPLCGLQLAFGTSVDGVGSFGTMDLHEGVVSDNEVCGVNVQDENFDIERLQDRVLYLDNGTNLDMGMSIWVPEAQVPDLPPLD